MQSSRENAQTHHVKDKTERAHRLIDQFKQERIKGSITVHFDDQGNVPKIEKREVL